MSKSDFLSLDGYLLHLFVLIYETGSVSQAAKRLNINQSSASHALERLRRLVGDPLFVRAGRGIKPTAHADGLVDKARTLLFQLECFAETEQYRPEQEDGTFTIAANDYEVETILRSLLPVIRRSAPKAKLRIVRTYAQQDWVTLLRENGADLVLAPTLQDSEIERDLNQQTLLKDYHLGMYDTAQRDAPHSLEAYCAASHAVMVTGENPDTQVDQVLKSLGHDRHVAVMAPSFNMLATMIKGTDIIATMPTKLRSTVFKGFATFNLPIALPSFSISQIWHCRNHSLLRHCWLRETVQQTVSTGG